MVFDEVRASAKVGIQGVKAADWSEIHRGWHVESHFKVTHFTQQNVK